jgi:hypothetical protein
VKIIVQTDRGATVASLDLSDRMPGGHIANSVWRDITGTLNTPMGWLGRALQDARDLEQGRDPERPSEKAMRLAMERHGDTSHEAAARRRNTLLASDLERLNGPYGDDGPSTDAA